MYIALRERNDWSEIFFIIEPSRTAHPKIIVYETTSSAGIYIGRSAVIKWRANQHITSTLRSNDLCTTGLPNLLARCAPRSKIIVTTRSRSVSSTIDGVLVHDLKRLSNEDCWSLFSKHAFGDRDPDEDSDLKRIGEKIVEKCNGLPLAIRTLASLLHYEVETEEWNNVLHSRIWDLSYRKSDILPALRLSYHHLPSQLKRCFSYCSIFPKGREFDKGDLVRMWIAEGLVQQPNSRRRMEDVGEQYFHELLSRSIFQQSCHDRSCFLMHDLINDLAQHIAGEFCFKFEDDSAPQNPARVRHLSCRPEDSHDKFEAFYGKNKVLRTFLPFRRQQSVSKTRFDPGVFKKLFPAPSRLHVLSLSSYHIVEFPDSVCDLKELRYLDISDTFIQNLPEGVGNLYNLETLKLSGCPRLTQLPEIMSNLTKLEHLDIKRTPIQDLPDSIGKLEQLGYLDLSGTKIRSLPDGVCSLYNLRTLKLSRCLYLTSLPTDMKNLTKLKHLDIKKTPLVVLLDSIGDLKQLAYLDLSGTQIQCLPMDMKNLMKLEHLDIKGTPILQMPPKFGNLKRLQVLNNFVVGNDSESSISEMKDLRHQGAISP